MAEYHANSFHQSNKIKENPYLTTVDSHGPKQNTIQIMQMGKFPAISTGKNQSDPIKKQEIQIKQDPLKVISYRNNTQMKYVDQKMVNAKDQQNTLDKQQKKRKPLRFSNPVTYYPGNTYIYPYYYDSSGCYYCCWFNGNCCPCETCHQCSCSSILCDPLPCFNGCTGFHCECLKCFSPCQDLECVQQNNCQCCQFLPCCSGCNFCSQACDGTCISAIPCCNGCQCAQLCQVLPCCNGCQCQHIFGCLPCCNDAICNIFGCLQGCQLCNCLDTCGNGFQCLGNCECGNCDCQGCDCNGCDLGDCDLGGCDLGNCDC